MPQAAPGLANPFPGLRPFRDDEEHLFFGREGQIDVMVDKLAAGRFLAVLGMSGSGKSSLLNCGLRPALHRGLMAQAGTTWKIVQFRPGRDPIGALATALSADNLLFPPAAEGRLPVRQIVEDTLRMSNLGLVDIVGQARLDGHTNVLLAADQFEELFRYRNAGKASPHAAEDATAFVNLLLNAAAQTEQRIYVVLTMRSDFLGDCAQFPGLPEAINRGQYLVPRLTRGERRAAIAGPVAVGGGTISPVLLTRLVNDVGDNPDQLSILQHALNRTWAQWTLKGKGQGELTVDDYEAIGTMAGALDHHAEETFAELESDRQRLICEKIFKALTDMGTDARGIRRPTQFQTLCAIADADPSEVAEVIERFRDPRRSFLMPPIGQPLQPETMVDLSHESLMRLWKRLGEWSHQEAESAQLYRRLSDTANRHAKGRAGLWSDPELESAMDWRSGTQPTAAWAELYGGGFETAMSFLEASQAARTAQLAREQAAQEKELEQARRLAAEEAKSAKQLRFGIVAASLAAIACLCLSMWAWRAQTKATKLSEVYLDLKSHSIDRLAEDQTPPSPSDTTVLWELADADPDVTRHILKRLFTVPALMRKASTRAYALRRSIVGFTGNRDELVRAALKEHCNETEMKDLYVTGVCVALGRGFYPADLNGVMGIEQSIGANWDTWLGDEARARYPDYDGALFRERVEADFLSMIHSLQSKDAAAFAKQIAKDWFNPQSAPKEHLRKAWAKTIENMNEEDALVVAIAILDSWVGEKPPSEKHKAALLRALTDLSNANSSQFNSRVWARFFTDHKDQLSDPSSVACLAGIASRLNPPDAAIMLRQLVTALPKAGNERIAWEYAAKEIAKRVDRRDAFAIAREVLDKPVASGGDQEFFTWFVALPAVTESAFAPNVTKVVNNSINRHPRIMPATATATPLTGFVARAKSALDLDLKIDVGRPVAGPASENRLPPERADLRKRIEEEILRRTAALVEAKFRGEADVKKRDALDKIQKNGAVRDALLWTKIKRQIVVPVGLPADAATMDSERVEEYRKLIDEVSENEKAFAVLHEVLDKAPSAAATEKGGAVRIISDYMRSESRALLDTGAFSAFLDVLTDLPASGGEREAAMKNLLKINAANRSVALCFRLDPNDAASTAALRLLKRWGSEPAVEKLIVEDILSWPDCPPNAVFPVVRELAKTKQVSPKLLGDRRGLVVMEQFAYWARANGYKFRPPSSEAK